MLKNLSMALLTILSVFIIAFLLNYIWETFHGAFLYEEHNFDAKIYVPHLAFVAIKDALIIVLLYLFMSLLKRNILWIKSMNRNHVIEVLISGAAIAIIFEVRAVYILHLWSYSNLMPTLFGIGLSPLLQLSVTMLLAIWITKKLIY